MTCSGAARRRASASVRPIATTIPAESTSGARPARARPVRSHASRTRSYAAAVSSTDLNGMLNSSAYRAASSGVRFGPRPPTMIGGPGTCTGFGSAGASTSR